MSTDTFLSDLMEAISGAMGEKEAPQYVIDTGVPWPSVNAWYSPPVGPHRFLLSDVHTLAHLYPVTQTQFDTLRSYSNGSPRPREVVTAAVLSLWFGAVEAEALTDPWMRAWEENPSDPTWEWFEPHFHTGTAQTCTRAALAGTLFRAPPLRAMAGILRLELAAAVDWLPAAEQDQLRDSLAETAFTRFQQQYRHHGVGILRRGTQRLNGVPMTSLGDAWASPDSPHRFIVGNLSFKGGAGKTRWPL